MKYLMSFNIRHAIAVGVAILIAISLTTYSFSQEGWMVLGAFLVSQTTRGTPLRQGLIFFVTINIAIIFAAIMMMLLTQPLYLAALVGLIFVACAFIAYLSQPLSHNQFYCLLYFALIILIATLIPSQSQNDLQDRIFDTALGSIIGMVCAQIIFPVKLVKEFSEGIIPILEALRDYTKAWSDYFAKDGSDLKLVTDKKLLIEATLQENRGIYPVWVYETGFNPGLRSGFRFFLVNLERVVETSFSLDYLGGYIAESSLPEDLAYAIANSMQKNEELLDILLCYFRNQTAYETKSDFTSDISTLENVLHQTVPDNLEALNVSQDYLLLTAIVRDVKDLRSLLLQLVMALPKPSQ